MLSEYDLRTRQALPLSVKIRMTEKRIEEWDRHWDGMTSLSFSGGKDSTCLDHIIRSMGMTPKQCPRVFVDTGVEYPEVRAFVKTFGDGVTWLRPRVPFADIIKKHGYPLVSKRVSQYVHEATTTTPGGAYTRSLRLTGVDKTGMYSANRKIPGKWMTLVDAPFKVGHRCCDTLKKNPAEKYERESGRKMFIGTMAEDSGQRAQTYMQYGCNAFDLSRPRSTPLGPWTEQDVLEYLSVNKVPISSIYGEIVHENGRYKTTGADRTGCMYCGFGAHLEGTPNRFQRLAVTHPGAWRYCMDTLGYREVLAFIGVPVDPVAPEAKQPEQAELL